MTEAKKELFEQTEIDHAIQLLATLKQRLIVANAERREQLRAVMGKKGEIAVVEAKIKRLVFDLGVLNDRSQELKVTKQEYCKRIERATSHEDRKRLRSEFNSLVTALRSNQMQKEQEVNEMKTKKKELKREHKMIFEKYIQVSKEKKNIERELAKAEQVILQIVERIDSCMIALAQQKQGLLKLLMENRTVFVGMCENSDPSLDDMNENENENSSVDGYSSESSLSSFEGDGD